MNVTHSTGSQETHGSQLITGGNTWHNKQLIGDVTALFSSITTNSSLDVTQSSSDAITLDDNYIECTSVMRLRYLGVHFVHPADGRGIENF